MVMTSLSNDSQSPERSVGETASELLHARPEQQPLHDARRSISCAMAALQAAVTRNPALGQQLDLLHAQLMRLREEIERIIP